MIPRTSDGCNYDLLIADEIVVAGSP